MPFRMLDVRVSECRYVSVSRANAIAKRLPHRIVDFEQRDSATTIMRQQMHSA